MKILVIFDVEHWKWIYHVEMQGYEWATVMDEQDGNYLFEELELYFHTTLLAMMRAGLYL